MALLAVDALGAERVTCVVMPSPHSSAATQGDARTIAANLGVEALEIPIEGGDRRLREALGAGDARRARRRPNLAAENIQARIRGNMMMALSNEPAGWC